MGIMKTKEVGKIKDYNGTITILTLNVLGRDFVRIAQPDDNDDQPEMIDLRKENLKKLITILKKIK